MAHAQRDDAVREEAPPFWEWVVAGVGLLLLLATLGYLLHDAATARRGPAAPSVQLLAVEPQGGRYLVRLRVHNDGDATATALRVSGTLRRGDVQVESREVELDYLPRRSSRQAAMLFTQDPRSLQLVLEPHSYREP